MTPIELLPADKFKILKIIQITGPDWNRFAGYLPYLRTFNPKLYDHKNGDLLDQKILDTMQHYFPNSILRYNIEILFKGQLEDNLRSLEGSSRKKITVQFSPDIPIEMFGKLAGQTFYAYPLEFEIRLLYNNNEEQSELINKFYLCSLPFDKLDEIIKTVKPV